MNKIILILTLILSLNDLAAANGEAKTKRYIRNGNVVTDSWTRLAWQDNSDVGRISENLPDSQKYCSSLALNGIKDWRIPTISELFYVAYPMEKSGRFKFTSPLDRGSTYYRSSNFRNSSWLCSSDTMDMANREIIKVFSCWSGIEFRCVSGGKFENYSAIQAKVEKGRKQSNYNQILNNGFANINSIEKYENLIKKYRNVRGIDKAKLRLHKLYENEFSLINERESLSDYHGFNKKHPTSPQVKSSISKIFNIIEVQNNLDGYEWFLTHYPAAPQAASAIRSIHRLAFEKAKELHAISSYNTFIVSYPTAKQVAQAQDFAYQLEVVEYTDFGTFGNFFGKEGRMEKSARKFLIKAKQIERKSTDHTGDATLGYILIANRMYDLLQDQFDDSDATLRHLESQEFKDFVKEFKLATKTINDRLDNIAKYSQEVINVAKQGFSDARADREMAAYKLDEHEKWEKFMHLKDKGYN